MRRLMTVTEFAEELLISEKTVRRWIAAGRLPAQRVGGRLVRIDRKDLAAILEPTGQ